MKKLAIFTGSIYTVGGEQRVVCLIANKLSEKYDVTVFTMDRRNTGNNIYGLAETVNVKCYHPHKGDVVSFVMRVATHLIPSVVYDWFPTMLERAYCPNRYAAIMNELISDEYDTVIATAWQLSIILGKVKRIYNREFKAIAWEHNSYEAYFEQKYFYLYKHEKLFGDALANVNIIVVLNDDYRKKYKTKLGLESTVIHNPKSFISDDMCDLNSKTIFACSRIDDKQKGIDLLLDSFEKYCTHNQDWRLIIAGDGPALKKYERHVSTMNCRDRVSFLGSVSDVKERMLESSLFVLPSRFEGFPMSVTEAFECGLPVLAYDIPAMEPFKESGGAVCVTCYDTKEYADMMLMLTDKPNLRYNMGEKARFFAKQLDIELIMEKWDMILATE